MILQFEHSIKDAVINDTSINNISVITAGEAKGHGVHINHAFLGDVVRAGNFSNNGIKSRFGHPSMCYESVGTEVGKFTNFRLKENQVIADFQFIESSYNKDMIDHIKTFSKNYPGAFGTSIEFEPMTLENGELDTHEEDEKYFVKLNKLNAVDFVDEPAANPNGLFEQSRFKALNKFIKQFIKSDPAAAQEIVDLLGLKKEEMITIKADDQVMKYFDKINTDIKILYSLINKISNK